MILNFEFCGVIILLSGGDFGAEARGGEGIDRRHMGSGGEGHLSLMDKAIEKWVWL